MDDHRRRFLALNDPRLARFLAAPGDAARAEALEQLLMREVQPRARAVLAGYIRARCPIAPQDVDDIVAQVTLRVLLKLRAATVIEEESVQNLEAYVTTLTRNAFRDLMRRRSPARARVKRRLRHLFSQDARLVMSGEEGTAICSLSDWPAGEKRLAAPEAVRTAAASAAFSSADEAVAVLTEIGRPVRLSDLVAATGAEDEGAVPLTEDLTAPPVHDAVEARQYLRKLWHEIQELPPRQRAALLFNLREPASGNAVVLFVSIGIASLDEIAAAMDLPAGELAAIWDELPFDDHRIAAQLGVERQQVINLRKSARDRLGRRMAVRSRQ